MSSIASLIASTVSFLLFLLNDRRIRRDQELIIADVLKKLMSAVTNPSKRTPIFLTFIISQILLYILLITRPKERLFSSGTILYCVRQYNIRALSFLNRREEKKCRC